MTTSESKGRFFLLNESIRIDSHNESRIGMLYSPKLVFSLLRLSAHHLALATSAMQPVKSGTLSLYLSVPVRVLIPSVVISRPTTAGRPSNPLNLSPLAPQIRFLLTIVRVYKLYLLTYLLTFPFLAAHYNACIVIAMPDEIIRATLRQRGTVLSPVSVSVTSRGFIKTSGWFMARIFLSICPALRCEEIWVLKIRALPSENFAKARRSSQRIVNRLDKGACDSLSN